MRNGIDYNAIERNLEYKKNKTLDNVTIDLARTAIQTHNLDVLNNNMYVLNVLLDPLLWNAFNPQELKILLIIVYCYVNKKQNVLLMTNMTALVNRLREIYNYDEKKVAGILNICKLYSYDFVTVANKLFYGE